MPREKGVGMKADKNTKVTDLPDDLTPDQARELFGTELDQVIVAMLNTLHALGYTDDEFNEMLAAMQELMEVTVGQPDHELTVDEAMPFVYLSDLLTLGGLGVELYKRQDAMKELARRHLT
jgi:hypothetical protein